LKIFGVFQGWQKLHSEQLVRAACPSAAVLRVPLLYGPVESPLDSASLLAGKFVKFLGLILTAKQVFW